MQSSNRFIPPDVNLNAWLALVILEETPRLTERPGKRDESVVGHSNLPLIILSKTKHKKLQQQSINRFAFGSIRVFTWAHQHQQTLKLLSLTQTLKYAFIYIYTDVRNVNITKQRSYICFLPMRGCYVQLYMHNLANSVTIFLRILLNSG